MARRSKDPQDTLEELESLGKGLAGWVQEHGLVLAGVAVGILVVAAAVGAATSWRQSQSDEASAAVADLRREFVIAMGGTANQVEIPEPANPERAREIREEYAGRFAEVARAYAGHGAAALAALEAGGLYLTLDFPDRALDLWKEAARAADDDSAIRALLEVRVGRLLEDVARFEDAARAHEVAASVESYPLRAHSLADAARCWLAADKPAEALRIYDQVQADFPDASLPDYVLGRLRQLKAQQGGAPAATENDATS